MTTEPNGEEEIEVTWMTEFLVDHAYFSPGWDQDELRKEVQKLHDDYYELLFQVATKVPGETRHQTAKRLLGQRNSDSATKVQG